MEAENLGFLEKTVKLIERYGLFKIFKALCVILLFVYIMCNGANLIDTLIGRISRETIDRAAVEKVEAHDRAMSIRQEAKPKIDDMLAYTLNKTDCDRVFVIEMHNGTNNTAGLPFVYGEMTYEMVRNGVTHIDEDYTNLNLSRFSFPAYVNQHHYWMGSIEELRKIDPKIAQRLASNDVTYLAIIDIHGVKNELGFFGITYCNGRQPKSREELITVLMEETQKLSTLLDFATYADEIEQGSPVS